MSGVYKVTGKHEMFGGKPGEIVHVALNWLEEQHWLHTGLISLVEREYRVIGGSIVHGAQPGETFKAKLTRGEEDHLVASGNAEPVEAPATDLSATAQAGDPTDKKEKE